MDGQQNTAWNLDDITNDAFDNLNWTADLGPFDLEAALGDTSYAIPGMTDGLSTLPAFDDLAFQNMSLGGPLDATTNADALDASVFRRFSSDSPAPLPPQQRTLPRRRSKYVLRRSGSGSRPIAIPSRASRVESPVQPLSIQRWQNSPPEQEAASLSAIYNAMGQRPLSGGPREPRTPSYDAFRA
jgi:hypothetical protein